MDFKKLISHIESIDGPIETPKAPAAAEPIRLDEDTEFRVLAGVTALTESVISEKAVSRAQQMAAGAALAAKRGEGKAVGASKEMMKMSTKELEKFAGTKHKGLPKKKTKEDTEVSEDDMRVGDTRRSSTGGTITRTATGITHRAKDWDGEDHVEPAQKKPSKAAMTGAERRAQKAADKEQEARSKERERILGKGSVTRHKMEDVEIDADAFNAKFSKMVEAAKPDFLDLDKDGDTKEPMKKAAAEKAGKKGHGKKGMSAAQAKYFGKKDESVEEGSTGDYSAKKARAGKDIGKPGKQFAKIAKSAGERYGSKERGEKVAGAVLKKMRAKEGVESDKQMVAESVEQPKMSFRDMMKLVVESGGQQQLDPLDTALFDWATRIAKNKLGEGMKSEIYAGLVYERLGGRFEMYDVLSEDQE